VCQNHCRLMGNKEQKAVVFTMKVYKGEPTCKCRVAAGAVRVYTKGAISGPTECIKTETQMQKQMVFATETQTEEMKAELAEVPMEEVHTRRSDGKDRGPCDKSARVKNFPEVQEKHQGWLDKCLVNATVEVVKEYNPFYKRFAEFIDELAYKAGCAVHPSQLPEEFRDLTPSPRNRFMRKRRGSSSNTIQEFEISIIATGRSSTKRATRGGMKTKQRSGGSRERAKSTWLHSTKWRVSTPIRNG